MYKNNIDIYNDFSKNGMYAINFMMASTIIQSVFGFARDASPVWKLCIALFCWCSLFFSIKNFTFTSSYPRYVKILVFFLIGSVSLSFFKSLITGVVYAGEKYTVIFTNMYATLDLIGVFFIATITDVGGAKYLLKAVYWMVPVSIICLLFNYDRLSGSYVLTYIVLFSSVFFPYLEKKRQLYLLGGYALSFVAFIGGGRQAAIILFFCVLSLLIGLFVNKKIAFVISLIIFISPLILLYYSVYYESIFSVIAQGKEIQDGLNTDTRTFLWKEFLSDMFSQSTLTQLFGKGVLGYYASDWFNGYHRFGIEVPILQWFLQSGLVYVVCFTLLVFFSIYYLYKYGQNKMCIVASVMISGVYFNLYVSNLVGCNISTMGIWFIISIAFNKNFLMLNDQYLSKIYKEEVT